MHVENVRTPTRTMHVYAYRILKGLTYKRALRLTARLFFLSVFNARLAWTIL